MINNYINYILSLSNILGFYALKCVIYRKKRISALFLFFVIFTSSIHHLTEKNEAGHSLDGLYSDNLGKYSYELRILDIYIAHLFFIYLIRNIGLFNLLKFMSKYKLIIILSFLLNFVCDYLISNKPNIYCILHLLWHIGIYFIIYEVSFIII